MRSTFLLRLSFDPAAPNGAFALSNAVIVTVN
jgi:hypothetical protein